MPLGGYGDYHDIIINGVLMQKTCRHCAYAMFMCRQDDWGCRACEGKGHTLTKEGEALLRLVAGNPEFITGNYEVVPQTFGLRRR